MIWVQLYVVVGLITLFALIQLGKKDELDFADISDQLGALVVYALLGWPYVLIVQVFSWSIWLKKL